MEHEEIVLDQKRDPRNKGTRYGIKGRGTIKFNKYQEYKERNFTGELQMASPTTSVTVSLKKRKNWEISQKSFDDGDINTRVVIMERNSDIADIGDLAYTLQQEREARSKAEAKEKEKKPEIINGTNRKGFFVREKRKTGKKGVSSNRNKSDGESSSDEDTSDSDVDNNEQQNKEEAVLCILTVPRNRTADFWNKGDGGCNCRGCRGIWEKNVTTRNRNIIKKEMIDML